MQVQHSNNTVTLKTFKYLHIYVLFRTFSTKNNQVVIVFFNAQVLPSTREIQKVKANVECIWKNGRTKNIKCEPVMTQHN